MKKIFHRAHVLIVPLIFVFLTVVIKQPCSGSVCLLSGNGYPLPFYGDGEIYWFTFVVDYVLAIISYLVILIIVQLVIKGSKKNKKK